jgi:hypothetical protein
MASFVLLTESCYRIGINYQMEERKRRSIKTTYPVTMLEYSSQMYHFVLGLLFVGRDNVTRDLLSMQVSGTIFQPLGVLW